jgi:hypothetical protein
MRFGAPWWAIARSGNKYRAWCIFLKTGRWRVAGGCCGGCLASRSTVDAGIVRLESISTSLHHMTSHVTHLNSMKYGISELRLQCFEL